MVNLGTKRIVNEDIPLLGIGFPRYSASKLRGSSPGWCVTAGKYWGDQQFHESQFILIQGISVNPRACNDAGREWIDERFAAHAQTLVDMLTESPEYAAAAGRSWNDDRVKLFKDELAKSVLQSAKASYHAIEGWHKWKLGEHRDAIISKAFSDPENCYHVNTHVTYILVDPAMEDCTVKIAEGLSKSAEYSFMARKDWQKRPFGMIKDHFPEDSYGALIAQIPEPTWNRLLEIESQSNVKFKRSLFYSNLPAVLDSGNVERWANTILEHFKEVAIGGDTYRIA